MKPRALALALVVATSCLVAFAAPAAADDPPLSVPEEELAGALACPDSFEDAEHEPVLLVHGTGTTPDENWSWNYSKTLPTNGWDVCTVDLPGRALGDIQVSTEYVVYAIRQIHAAAGEKVDVMGHSQGGLEPRWALRWWPSVREKVDDLVMFATPNHGTLVANVECADGRCHPAVHQMQTDSTFIRLLNSEDESPGGVSYTSLYSATDELVQPVAPEPTAAVEGAVNILLQDLCPGRVVDHLSIIGDAVAHAMAIDALGSDGPADPSSFDPATCAQLAYEGVNPAVLLTADQLGTFLGDVLGGSFQGMTESEPEPAPYTQPSAQQQPYPPEPAGEDEDTESDGTRETPVLPASGGGLAALGLGVALLSAIRTASRST